MKIKVDKEEYENLLKRVEELEEYKDGNYNCYVRIINNLERYMEDFFKNKCMTVIVKRDKDMIAAEIRKNIMDNLFKEEA